MRDADTEKWLQSLVEPGSVDQEAQAVAEGRPPELRYLNPQKAVAAVLDIENELERLGMDWELLDR